MEKTQKEIDKLAWEAWQDEDQLHHRGMAGGTLMTKFMNGFKKGYEAASKNFIKPDVIKSVCDCEIPYFPTGNTHWCSKCNKPTIY